jgi:hypothetical protein
MIIDQFSFNIRQSKVFGTTPSGLSPLGGSARQTFIAIRAAQRVDVLADEGDLNGAIVWRRILEAIDELMRSRRAGEQYPVSPPYDMIAHGT